MPERGQMKLPHEGDWVKAWPDGQSVTGVVILVDSRNGTFVVRGADLRTWGIDPNLMPWVRIT